MRFLTFALLVVSQLALAQELELDISEEKKPAAPLEFRPVIGVISVKAGDKEETSLSRARQLEQELMKELHQNDQFQTVIDPSMVRSTLGPEFAVADACLEYSCLENVAKKLKAHRLIRLTVVKTGPSSTVTLHAWDPGSNETIVLTQDSGEKAEKSSFGGISGKSQAAKDKEFMRKMIPFLTVAQSQLSTPLAKIVIDNADPSAIVTIDGAEAGIGSVEQIVQKGEHKVKVIAAGYKPFTENVSIAPLETKEVKVTLIAIPMEEKVSVAPVSVAPSPFYAKPGLYLAIVGAAAVVTGVILGQNAMGVKKRIEQGGDPLTVTRAEAKGATTNALLSNILVGAGSAAVVGGVTWIVVTLPPPAPEAVIKPGGDDKESVVVPGAMIRFGGTF